MCQIASFTFNAFQENTYLLFDDTRECVIIDPGCYTAEERRQLTDFIDAQGLKPVRLINTHAHIDHVLGNWYVADRYGIGLEMHEGEVGGLEAAPLYGSTYGFQMQPSPAPTAFLAGGDTVTFGETTLQVLFTPGHSPASISLYCAQGQFVIAGDVLFRDSIGRVDLPGGDFATLIHSIETQYYPLGDDTHVFPGHGPSTTIGHERAHNPFLTGQHTL